MKISSKLGRTLFAGSALLFLLATSTFAQEEGGAGQPPFHQRQEGFDGPGSFGPGGPGGPGFGPHGPAWWKNPRLAQKLALTSDQQKKLEDLFLQSQLKAIDLKATLEKEELVLHSLSASEQADESKIFAQIDKVAQARAELEKEHVHTMLGVKHVLTPEQWNKLHSENHGEFGSEHVQERLKSDHDHGDRDSDGPPR